MLETSGREHFEVRVNIGPGYLHYWLSRYSLHPYPIAIVVLYSTPASISPLPDSVFLQLPLSAKFGRPILMCQSLHRSCS